MYEGLQAKRGIMPQLVFRNKEYRTIRQVQATTEREDEVTIVMYRSVKRRHTGELGGSRQKCRIIEWGLINMEEERDESENLITVST